MADKMKQEGGDYSNNVQVAGNAQFGITTTEARQIALDVFKANFYDLSVQALQIAEDRAKIITEEFIEKFFSKSPQNSSKLETPAVQCALYEVQKGYAKTGDEQLKNQLLELLVNRIGSEERSLLQITLDEALAILPKLTQEQINILTLVFSAIYYNHKGIVNLDTFYSFLNNKLAIFIPNKQSSYSFYTHLQFTGCCTILTEGSTYKPFEQIVKNRYQAFVTKGFSKEDFEKDFLDDSSIVSAIIINHLQNNSLLQFNALNDSVLDYKIEQHQLHNLSTKIHSFNNKYLMSDDEVVKRLIEINPIFESFITMWKDSDIKALKPTSVGFAIAILNYNMITGENLQISDFI